LHGPNGGRDLSRAHPAFSKPSEDIGTRPWLWFALLPTRILTPPADPVVLLGDIRKVQEMGEGPGDGEGGHDRHRAQEIGESIEIVRAIGACGNPVRGIGTSPDVSPLRQRPHLLDPLEDAGIRVLREYSSQQLA
jgi:hypothetical protein